MDSASAQARRARAVAGLRHWVEVLWREVDDLVDDDDPTAAGEHSEGFRDYRGTLGSQDHEFDADVRISVGGKKAITLNQSDGSMVGFLRGLDGPTAMNTTVRLRIGGEVLGDALDDWLKALGAASLQLSEALDALTRASRESTLVVAAGAESAYSRALGLVEVRLPPGVPGAEVEVECEHGAVLVAGEPVEGPVVVTVNGTATLVCVNGRSATSRLLGHSGSSGGSGPLTEVGCAVSHWWEIGFGGDVLDHGTTG
jgi:hypothetical protein